MRLRLREARWRLSTRFASGARHFGVEAGNRRAATIGIAQSHVLGGLVRVQRRVHKTGLEMQAAFVPRAIRRATKNADKRNRANFKVAPEPVQAESEQLLFRFSRVAKSLAACDNDG